MKLIGVEEHFVTSDVFGAWEALDPEWQDLALVPSTEGGSARRLADLGDGRLADMDRAGLDVAVLSMSTPGVQNLAPTDAVELQVDANDFLAEAIRHHPDRYQGLATLATPDPDAAAAELERAVAKLGLDGAMLFGRTREYNMDDARFWPIYEAAADLKAPLHLHPQSPRPAVRTAYYDGFEAQLSAALATHGMGWHYESGVQVLRLILSGVFDRFPDLQVIVGHWGEMVLFYLDRIDSMDPDAGLPRPIADYFRTNIHLTPSGVLSQRYLRWATELVGIERILFSTDYPFVMTPDGGARRFLDQAPVSDTDRSMIASTNWDRLRASIRRS